MTLPTFPAATLTDVSVANAYTFRVAAGRLSASERHTHTCNVRNLHAGARHSPQIGGERGLDVTYLPYCSTSRAPKIKAHNGRSHTMMILTRGVGPSTWHPTRKKPVREPGLPVFGHTFPKVFLSLLSP